MHNLDEETEERLEALLNQQISTVLTKIQEEDQSPLDEQQNEDDEEEGEQAHPQYGCLLYTSDAADE
mgnify:CR=1 FL=1